MARSQWSLETSLAEFSSSFRRAAEAFDFAEAQSSLHFALNGHASAELRRTVPIEYRRSLGAFFTDHNLALQLTESLAGARGDVVVVDPSCGAGDLLLAAARSLELSLRSGSVRAHLFGIDIIREFVETAEYRFDTVNRLSDHVPKAELRVGEGREATELKRATHLLLNPPFSATIAHDDCTWAQGNVSGAAEFLAAAVSAIPQNCQIAAILPEVLRGGSRYRKWREWIAKRVDIEDITSIGRFDRWTDIDVFMLRGRRVDGRRRSRQYSWTPTHTQTRVADRFHISVGPVVHNRDPKDGPLRPFLVARGLPPWEVVTEVTTERQFAGRTHRGPFVAVARTSRPDETGRARATIIADTRQIAVDNHLLILTPIEGGVNACRSLMSLLRGHQSDAWLDQAIRCRHLTVGAVGSLPWTEDSECTTLNGAEVTRAS